jgi:hypothetical protein
VRNACAIEPPIDHRDITTIMALLGDIKNDVREIRTLLEDDNGEEEEAPEADPRGSRTPRGDPAHGQ